MHEQVIHVRYSDTGSWAVQPDDRDAPISHHPTATAAERAAIAYAATAGEIDVVIHDRYARVHVAQGRRIDGRARPSGSTRTLQEQADGPHRAVQAAARSPR